MTRAVAAPVADRLSAADALEMKLEGAADIGLGVTRWSIIALAMAFAAFQLWTALFNSLAAITLRSVHASFLVLLCLLIFSAGQRPRTGQAPWYDWLLAGLATLCGVYFYLEAEQFGFRVGFPTSVDLVVGSLFVVLVFEATRRATGYALPLLCGAVLLWGFFGQYLPGALAHRGYDYDQIVGQLVIGTEGLFGTATAVSATYIFLFVLFAAFLQQSGILTLFNDIAIRLVGGWRSGPAQACIVSSALMGTISGSGIANVVTSGQVTIPLMRRYGYRSEFAAGVEVSSSMGGQIMPPVMGAGAFIMAEMLGIPYATIAMAAVIPAILYFLGIAWVSYLEARRLDLSIMGERSDAALRTAMGMSQATLRGRLHLLLPLAVIIALLFGGYTPIYSALAALGFTIILILSTSLAPLVVPKLRWLIYVVTLGVASALLYWSDSRALIVLIAALGLACAVFPSGRATLLLCFRSAYHGTINAVAVGITCVIVGVFDGIFGLSGVMLEVASSIVALGADHLWLSLVLAMAICLVLGLGLPTVPSYVICAVVVTPALAKLGVAALVSHMFVFYFSVLAQLTPPVALAAIAALPFAGPNASSLRISVIGTMLALSGVLVPFVAVYSPELLLIEGAWSDTILATLRVLLAVGYSGVAMIGYFRVAVGAGGRLALAIGALLLVSTDFLWFSTGAVLGLFVLTANAWERPRQLISSGG
ncbi:TRAP transporter fused permease subunit [Bradyrhizobium sp. LHD-71]|uniref:TRAP transporter permease n=1 Tax=Bradyrhizobium sp. LHD-71 TaxID=3072141 RepID=UPI00280EE3AC|nr:TRAP transporter fused permease subunit [Bradyrhizobium sp. LHD-71]MDQ8730230.1 TRAP transporter fused permease subunit [Bradyrhizobium sp. LHD-71]